MNDLEPYYESVFKAETVELKIFDAQTLTSIDDWTALEILVNSSKEVKADYLNYLWSEHGSIQPKTEDRLPYTEAGHLGNYIVWKFKKNQTDDFDKIFLNAEFVIKKGTDPAQNLIVVGFFEAIQNISSWEKVKYHTAYDRWLQPQSKKAWGQLIEFWEGNGIKSP